MRTYKDSNGNGCSLAELVRREPDWATSRILQLEMLLDDICVSRRLFQEALGRVQAQRDQLQKECDEAKAEGDGHQTEPRQRR